MAYQDTGKGIVIFMVATMVLSFAVLITLWAIGTIPTTNTPQVLVSPILQLHLS